MAPSSTGSLPSGTRLGRYEIVSLLAAGGMGEVYVARDATLGRSVALKVLPTELAADRDRVARFVREVEASSALNHPAILTVYDAGAEVDVHWLAMELIDGDPLSQWMNGRHELRRKLDVMAQVADGLAAAHAAGIVHRDLKLVAGRRRRQAAAGDVLRERRDFLVRLVGRRTEARALARRADQRRGAHPQFQVEVCGGQALLPVPLRPHMKTARTGRSACPPLLGRGDRRG